MSLRGNRTIGIMREVKNKWERRCALVPRHVKELTSKGIRVLIQPSQKRIFKDFEYEQAGAEVTEDLTPASLIIGVKEFPIQNLIPDRSYIMFSHVIKAQAINMPFLDAVLEKNVRLFDYEKITNEKGERLVAFGGFAGVAGMITGLRGFGEHLLSQGYQTPWVFMSSAYTYPSLPAAEEALKHVGREIIRTGLPRELGPCVFGFTGLGNVTKGCMEMFKHLPVQWITPAELQDLWNNPEFDNRKVYGVLLSSQDMVRRVDGEAFDKAHYYAHPEEHEPVFHENIAPYISVLVNGMYWDYRYPRLLTNTQLIDVRKQNPNAMQGLFDITCDIGGSVEALTRSTYPEAPFFTFDPVTDQTKDYIDGDGLYVMGVDMLPAELPVEASEHFSRLLYPFIGPMSTSDGTVAFEHQVDLPPELQRACIASNGKLNKDFKYISFLRRKTEVSSLAENTDNPTVILQIVGHLFDTGLINQMLDLVEEHDGEFNVLQLQSRVNVGKTQRATRAVLQVQHNDAEQLAHLIEQMKTLAKLVTKSEAKLTELPHGAEQDFQTPRAQQRRKDVLILGSGFVVPPVVEYLTKNNNFVTVASGDLQQAEALCNRYQNSRAVNLDVLSNKADLEQQIQGADVVISLVPFHMHVPIAEMCIKHKKNLVTASYTSDAMRDLDFAAKSRGITIVNEMGLDPGLDHMSALKVIKEIKESGSTLKTFSSLCGVVPAPEANNNPLGYKFSWNPMGVLIASQNASKYLENGKVVDVPGNQLLRSSRPIEPRPIPMIPLETIPNRNCLPYMQEYNIPNVEGMFRGTIRYNGFCTVMEAFRLCGLLDNTPVESPEMPWTEFLTSLATEPVDSLLAKHLPKEEVKYAMDSFDWLGLFDDKNVKVQSNSAMGALCPLLQDKLYYGPAENDMVVMQHMFGIETATGQSDMITSSLVNYGNMTHTATARTVGYPVAITAQILMNGHCEGLGVITASNEDLWTRVLPETEALDMRFRESYGAASNLKC